MSLDDRFDIGQPIHIGQIATAYPAVEKEYDRQVLIKVIHPQWTGDSELVERFSREGQAMERIDHPNVVRIIEYGSEDDAPYLVLEWVDGGTLAEKIASGPIHQDMIKQIAGELLAGLKAVHTEGLLHRDIKPDNILLDTHGHAKLADFSLVGFEQMSGLTGHGVIVGSPAYMAPELLDGKPATQRSDLYGIGLVLLEALTGSNPFMSSDPLVSLDLVRRANPPNLTGRSQIDPE
ncbi:MAG: serine/threonine-protein kinase, partial [Candidatus Electryoneaceae bacterium]|nr:serine/threonine-protein kinase [Candidatus Electryoneaceae bacterium]